MQAQWWWWILAVGLGVLEVLTGTFYLLVLALGCAAGGVAALAGLGITGQVLATAAVTVAGWFWLRKRGRPLGGRRPADSDPNVMLDIGQRLKVDAWTDGRRTQAQYRGAAWAVELEDGAPDESARPGEFVIRRVSGNRLVVRRAD